MSAIKLLVFLTTKMARGMDMSPVTERHRKLAGRLAMSKIRLFSCVGLLLLASPVFAAENSLDFDGKTSTRYSLGELFGENGAVSPFIPTSEVDSGLLVKREILTESGDWVEIKPIKTWYGSGVKYNQYTIKPGWAWRWTLRCAKGKWTAKETYSFWNNENGGHYHSDPLPPPLWVSSASVSASTAPFHVASSPILFPEMKANTTYYYWERFPEFAAKVKEDLESYGACQGSAQTDYIDVKIPGLVDMPEGQNYVLYNSDEQIPYHPDNHYGVQKLIDTLKTIADGYRAVFPNDAPIQINDMSLPWGGVFDYLRNWKIPLLNHDTGVDADIDKKSVPEGNRQKLLEIMCRNADTYSEQVFVGEVPYFHVRSRSAAASSFADELFESDKAMVRCCNGNTVDPATLQRCLSVTPQP